MRPASRAFRALFTALATSALAGCNPHAFERAAMISAFRPDRVDHLPPAPASPDDAAPRYELLAGDMHTHISPPDSPADVRRGVADTISLAADEGLDFVVLTPHLPARFFADPALRASAAAGAAEMRRAFASASRTIFIPGFEYTDFRYGHVGASFADLDQVLADVPLEVARKSPERFFERWVADGGLLVANHPLVTPLHSMFASARADMSWRPWTSRLGVPPEIQAVSRLLFGYEAYNAAVAQLRDRFLLGDVDLSVRGVLERMDR